jgi:hypothetical protein
LRSWDDGWKNFAVSATGIAGLAILILAAVYFGRELMSR